MKAIDLWVLVCILFVFSTLAEYGFVLYLTSRSAWQKRVDQYIKEHTKGLDDFVRLKIIRLLEVEKNHGKMKNKPTKAVNGHDNIGMSGSSILTTLGKKLSTV